MPIDDASTGKPWVGPREYAELYSLNVATIYKMVESGQLPSVRFGKVIRIPADATPTP